MTTNRHSLGHIKERVTYWSNVLDFANWLLGYADRKLQYWKELEKRR